MFSIQLLLVLGDNLFFHPPPQGPMTDFEGFSYQILYITFYPILILKKEPVFPFF